MTLDWDGRIRMDPSSPFAMAGLVGLRDRFDLALGNDADADRHGVVVPGSGLMNPNHVLAAAISYLFGGHRRGWGARSPSARRSSRQSIIDRVVADLGRRLVEVPVGFKWFVDGLVDGSIGFGGEESAGASFLRRDGRVWTTDKDGITACLLAAELTATLGRNPAEVYAGLTERFGAPAYRRIDAPATPEQKARLGRLTAADVAATQLAGAPITAILTTAPGNGASIGGLKVETADAWFAARPSGTENVTSCTRRASRATSTSGGCSRRRRRSSRPRRPSGHGGSPTRRRSRRRQRYIAIMSCLVQFVLSVTANANAVDQGAAPSKNITGKNAATVVSVAARTGNATSRPPFSRRRREARPTPCACICFSSTTTELSINRKVPSQTAQHHAVDGAAASESAMKVASPEIGMEKKIATVARRLPRKMENTVLTSSRSHRRLPRPSTRSGQPTDRPPHCDVE